MKGFTRAQWISLNWNNRSILAYWYSLLWEKRSYPPTASESYGREGGKTKYGWVSKFRNSRYTGYLSFYCVYYHCNVATYTVLELHFSRLLSSKAYFKVCLEVWKILQPFFSCQSLLLGTIISSDIASYIYFVVWLVISSDLVANWSLTLTVWFHL